MSTVPLLFAADSNYVKYLYVAIVSLLENSKSETFYDCYVLTPKIYKSKDFDYLKTKYKNFKINYVIMGNEFDNKLDKKRFLPSSSYYYLKIAEIIKDYPKAIYLDPDIIVLEDLQELYNLDLENNIVAGVKAAGYMDDNLDNKKYYNSIGLEDLSQYINANSLVFNLDLIRENNITELFCELSKNAYNSMDQDVLNIVCFNKIKHIPLKYNLMVKYLPFNSNKKWTYELLEKIYGKEQLEEANKPAIIHYANYNEKPWFTDVQLSDVWWKYAKLTPYFNEFKADYYIKGKFKPKVKKIIRKILSISSAYDEMNIKYKIITILGKQFKIRRY